MEDRLTLGAPLLALFLAAAPAPAAAEAPAGTKEDVLLARLRARVERVEAGLDGILGLYVKDLKSGRTVLERRSEDAFPAASTIKVAVLYDLYRQAAEGTLDAAEQEWQGAAEVGHDHFDVRVAQGEARHDELEGGDGVLEGGADHPGEAVGIALGDEALADGVEEDDGRQTTDDSRRTTSGYRQSSIVCRPSSPSYATFPTAPPRARVRSRLARRGRGDGRRPMSRYRRRFLSEGER